MKIVVNAVSAKRGGIVTYTANLIEAFRKRHIDAVVATPLAPQAQIHLDGGMGVRASEFGPVARLLWEQLFWRWAVARMRPDVLYSSANFGLINSPVPQVLLIREGGLFDPFYLTNTAPAQGARTTILRNFRRRLMLLSARHADHVITPSQTTRDLLLLWLPEIGGKCSVIPYGTLSELYAPARRPRRWREDGVLRLLYVSVYYPHKNPAILCDAVARLNAEGSKAHATITMNLEEMNVPGGRLDAFRLSAAEQAGGVTLGSRPYRELPDLYRSHDVFVFPSVSETFGHPMAEALAVGIPVVAADTSINREICGDAALYFRPYSITDLFQRLTELDRSPALRERLAKAARERPVDRHSWDRHVDRLIETFEAVRRK